MIYKKALLINLDNYLVEIWRYALNKDLVAEKVSSKLRRIIEKRYREYVVYVYLFGSTIENRFTCESDVDIAIRFYDHVNFSGKL